MQIARLWGMNQFALVLMGILDHRRLNVDYLPGLSVQLTQNVQIILHASEKNAKILVLLAPVALMLNVKRNDIVLYAIVNRDMKEILTEFVKNLVVKETTNVH
jgi:hypothetical protein